MWAWQTNDLAMALLALAGIVLVVGFIYQMGRRRRERQRLADEQAAAKAASINAVAAKAAASKAAAANVQAARITAEQMAARRAATEQAARERIERDKAAVEQEIIEWAAAEQAEAERIQLRRATAEQAAADEMDFHLRAVEDAIAEWVIAEQSGNRWQESAAPVQPTPDQAKKTYGRTDAVRQQVRLTTEMVAKEIQELEFIKNRIETGVDFLPIEFRQTVEHWKEGRAFRQSSFDDIKLKFRYKAYSIEDGYELLRMYSQWRQQQQQKLRIFIQLLGTKTDSGESIPGAIERAERNERKKELEMDMDVLFILGEIRDIFSRLIAMDSLLKELEVVCQRRSEQIIAPTWEAKGSL